MDSAADKATVIRYLSEASWLHIACHGVFQTNQPDSSGLVLAPGPGQAEILSVRELSGLKLNQLQHVTLSSCWSADSFILPGRWIISLPEVLWRAGAQSILSCLWVVDDSFATAFMTRFYAYLDSMPGDEALRHAQIDCLKGHLTDYKELDASTPLYWAGYNLYGDPINDQSQTYLVRRAQTSSRP